MNVKITETHFKKHSKEIENSKRSPLRKIVMSVLERDLKDIKNKKVLEIGCGDWDYSKKIVEKNKCEWHGFEPVDLGKNNLTIVKGSVENIPYHDNSFDLIICNQTIEHWFEYGVTYKKALDEINRVLKPNGIAMINAPIHVHGDIIFLRGEYTKIKKLFKHFKINLFEKCIPDEKIKSWKRIAASGFFSKFGYPNQLITNHNKATSHIINIHLKSIKKEEQKQKLINRNYIVLMRFIKRLFTSRL